jgi:uncharacterized membrane protein
MATGSDVISQSSLSVRQVPFLNAVEWTKKGFELFRAFPAMWIILFVIYLIIMVPTSMIPGFGSIASTLLAPIFAAGLMWGCRAITQGQDLEINHLFAGFKKNTRQLVTVGAIYMTCLMLIAIFVVMSLDRETVDAMVKGQPLNPAQTGAMMLPLLIAMFLLVPVLMAYWFAPILTGLHGLSAIEAMKLSFSASFKNILPFLLYGTIFLLLLVVAIIPFGIGLVIVVPWMMTSLYASYADIFNIQSNQIQSQN